MKIASESAVVVSSGPGDSASDIYRDLFNNLLNGLAYCRMISQNGEPVDFEYLAVNSAFSALTGLTDVVGKRVSQVIPGFTDSDLTLLRVCNRVATTGMPERFEYFVSSLGKWFLVSAYSPKPQHFVAVFDDVTGRKQVEETLATNQLALRHSEELYRTLTEWAPIALIVHSGGRLIYANPAAIRLAGAQSQQDLLGKNVFDLVHPEFREIAKQRSAQSAQLGGLSPLMEQKYLKLDGSVINVEVQSAGVIYDGAPAVQVVIHDITARKQAEVALSRVNRALTTLNACNEALIHTTTEADLLQSICRLIVEIGGYRFAWIGIARLDQEKTIQPVAQFGGTDEELSRLRTTWADNVWGRGPTGTAIRAATTQVNQDFLTNGAVTVWREWAHENGFKASISLPLIGVAGPIGALTIYAAESNAFDQAEIKLLEGLAQNLSYGIKSIRTRTASEAFADQLRKLSLIVEQSPESIVITNLNAEIEYVNEAFVRNTGYSRDEAIGKNPRLLQSTKTPRESYAALWSSLTQGQPWSGDLFNRRKDGSEYVERAIIAPIRDASGAITHYMAVKEDITARKIAEDRIQHLAFYDQLTDLPNRRLLLDRLQSALADAPRKNLLGAVLYIDLDNFKTINDTLGHPVGDQVLTQVAERLTDCAGAGDTVARLGGDDFLVMLVDLPPYADVATRLATERAERILRSLRSAIPVEGVQCQTSASIGIALWGNSGNTTETILKQVDMAMYAAKADGRNTYRFFDRRMQEVVDAEAALESDLRAALQDNQFCLYYQPQVDQSGRIFGAEALVRWNHPQRGLVCPSDFVPLAERTRLIVPIGRWVLDAACQQLKQWSGRAETARLKLSINISAIQLHQPDFVSQVLGALKDAGADPGLLKLELTESLLLSDLEDTSVKMTELRGHGVLFSLDDFGTGYSSLSYLRKLQLDQLKIDQSFIREIPDDPNACAITRTIIALGQTLGLSVIAEGVENEAQRDFLQQSGCGHYQGYLMSWPLPIDDFNGLLADGKVGR